MSELSGFLGFVRVLRAAGVAADTSRGADVRRGADRAGRHQCGAGLLARSAHAVLTGR